MSSTGRGSHLNWMSSTGRGSHLNWMSSTGAGVSPELDVQHGGGGEVLQTLDVEDLLQLSAGVDGGVSGLGVDVELWTGG